MPGDAFDVALDDGRVARVVFTDRTMGDFAIDGDPGALTLARRRIAAPEWTWLRQVHGDRVVVVDTAGQHAGEEADAAITTRTGAPLSVQAADCAPLALVGAHGAVGVVHAGWRGLLAGVIERAVDALRAAGGGDASAFLGPCIHPECYEFSEPELAPIVDRLGPSVQGRTADGTVALDLPAAVRAACADVGVALDESRSSCTGCSADAWFSHRARGETGRHAVVAWIDDAGIDDA